MDLSGLVKNDSKMCVQQPVSEENKIVFCSNCGCEVFEEIDVQYEFEQKSEYLLICSRCKHIVNEWGYGFFRNEKDEKYIIEEKRRMRQKKFNKINGMDKKEN